MEKKYIKIIKHLYKNLQKKDELKNEFEKTSNSILSYLLGTSFGLVFILLFTIWGFGIVEFIFSLIFSFMLSFFIAPAFSQINIFNNFVSKKLSKYNLFNLYGRNYNFNVFLFNILEEIIKNTEKEDLKFYTKEITHIINSIHDESAKNNIKMKFIEKMEIDVDSQLINLKEYKAQEKNIIKIDCKSILFNSWG